MSSSILGPEWNLCPEGLNIVTQNGAVKDSKTILKNALDSDLKTIGKPALANELSKSRIGKIVLQIQKIRNISAPKAKEESQAAPRMLKLTLTDGESYIQAIEMSAINSISREKTAPGTKVLINGAAALSGYLLINPQNFTVLGGQVEHLFEKWLLAKSIQQNHQYVSNEGAPPWVAFGCKIISGNQDKSFKSLEKNKDSNNDSEFEQQRKDAIAEASTGAVRKTFGGRVKQNVQPVQNNQQFIKGGRSNEREYDRSKKGKFTQKDDDMVEKLQRPSEKVSLFSFLEDKLPLPEPKKLVESRSQSASFNTKQNNLSNQKDTPRIQPKSEGNYNRNENKTANKSQLEKSTSYQKNERFSSQPSYNSSASKQTNAESVNSITKNLPHKSYNTSSNANSKPNVHENSNSNNIPNTSDMPNNVTNYYPRNSQQNQYRSSNERYPQQQNANSNPRDNFFQLQSQSGYYNNPRQQQKYEVNDSRPSNRPQYPNSNSYQQPNTQYHPKPQQNFMPNSLQNAEMHHLANNLSKMSVSNEFASRSLRQHLNLGPPKRQELQQSPGIVPNSLNVGDQCMARYWEDGKFYPATVAAITEKTYAVQFTGYGNIEEVLKHDCFSPANSYNQHKNQNYPYPQTQFSGNTMEFRCRRGPPRN